MSLEKYIKEMKSDQEALEGQILNGAFNTLDEYKMAVMKRKFHEANIRRLTVILNIGVIEDGTE